MASIASFDKEIQQTRKTVEDMRAKLAQSGVVLESLADSDKTIGDTNFDIENARIEDVLQQQKVMEANIADLIIGLEDATGRAAKGQQDGQIFQIFSVATRS